MTKVQLYLLSTTALVTMAHTSRFIVERMANAAIRAKFAKVTFDSLAGNVYGEVEETRGGTVTGRFHY